MYDEAINCTACDTTCYQECTGCKATCSDNCTANCTGKCDYRCISICAGVCSSTCISRCTGTCSETCTGSGRSTTGTGTKNTGYYINGGVSTHRPKTVKVSDSIFIMFLPYSTGTSSSAVASALIAMAFSVDSSGKVTFGTPAVVSIKYADFDVISSYESTYDTTIALRQVVVASGISTNTVVVFTINVEDDLSLTVGTSSNISTSKTPTIQYASYAIGYSPTANYNFSKLVLSADSVFISSISYAKQYSLLIGGFSSTGLELDTSAVLDENSIDDPAHMPHLFFNSYMNYDGCYSIENWYKYCGEVYFLSTPTNLTTASLPQNRAMIIAFNPSYICGNTYSPYIINGETPYVVSINKLTGSINISNDIYVVVDMMYLTTSYTTARVTPYAFIDGIFVQCGGGKIIPGVIKLPGNFPREYISTVMLNDNSIIVCTGFYDNVYHTRGARYIIGFVTRIDSSINWVRTLTLYNYLDDGVHTELTLGTNNIYYAPSLKYFNYNSNDYLLVFDKNSSSSIGIALLKLKLYTYARVSIDATYELYSPSTSYYTSAFEYLFHYDEKDDAFHILFWGSSGANTYNTAYASATLKAITFSIDPSGTVSVTVSNDGALTTASDEGGYNALPTTSYSIIVGEIFYDNIIVVITKNLILTYSWNYVTDIFTRLDEYTITDEFTTSSYYYNDNWYCKYSDDELLLLDIADTSKAILLQITPTGRIINLGYARMTEKIETFNTTTHKLISVNGTPYLINSTGSGAMSAASFAVTHAFGVLPSYGDAIPPTITMDDSSFGEVCKTVTPYIGGNRYYNILYSQGGVIGGGGGFIPIN